MAEEKRFEEKIKKFLDEKGCYYIKHFANSYTKSGVPDILACVGGWFMGIEVKASKGKPSALQIHHLKQIDDAGGYAILLYPDDFDKFKDLVEVLTDGDPANDGVYYDLYKRWVEYANVT